MATSLEFDAPAQERKLEFDEPASNASTIVNIAMGAAKGAADIGATILSPIDAAARMIGIENSIIGRDDRRQVIEDVFRRNADPESLAFKTGQIGTQIAGTAGAGGLIAKGLGAIPGVAAAAPKLISSMQTGGLTLGSPAAKTLAGRVGDLALRTLGGATAGGAAAGLVDPETAGTGAMIGGAIPGGVQAAGAIGHGLGFLGKKLVGGLTGVGDEAFTTALQAGRDGNQTLLQNMRGKVSMTDVIDDAKAALDNMRIARSAEYRAGMEGIAKDKTILDFTPIRKELANLQSMGSFKGKVINKNAAGTVDEIAQTVDEWAKLNPAEYHTPEGLDALKKAIGDIRDSTQFGSPSRKAADQIYNAVKKQITAQAPEYSKVMKGYSEATELIDEINRALSLGEKASVDTAMRKLQSLMRNNVQTNWGNRLNLARELEAQGGREILPAIAGQSLSDLMPRGLARMTQQNMGLLGLLKPAVLALAPFTSPRLMGEAAYGLGRMASGTSDLASSALARTLPPQTLAALARPSSLRTVAPTIALTAP